jgi:hypothetical protein
LLNEPRLVQKNDRLEARATFSVRGNLATMAFFVILVGLAFRFVSGLFV